MKPPARQDFGGGESTDAGQAVDDSADVAAEEAGDEDEFPSEATRVDGMGGFPSMRPMPTGPASSSKPVRIATGGASVSTNSTDKLAALQSLSLSGGSSSSLPPPPTQQGGSTGIAGKIPWIIAIAAVGVLAFNKLHGGGPKVDPNAVPAIRTEIVTPTGGSGQAPHVAAGFMGARQPISVAAPVSGSIKDVKVENGDKVKKNQLLVQLDDSAARADSVAAGAELRAAVAYHAQLKRMFNAGAATAAQVAEAAGKVDIAQGRLAPIHQRTAQARIASPIDGWVLDRLVQPGETVNASTVIVKLADLTDLTADSDIVEADIGKIHKDQTVIITSDVQSGRTYEGKVYEIASSADKAKGTVQVRTAVRVPDLSLKVNNAVRCSFQPDKGEKAHIYISKSSINAQTGVWLVGSDGKVTNRPVTTVPGSAGNLEVTQGLTGGERIVVDANQAREGMTINLAPPPPAN